MSHLPLFIISPYLCGYVRTLSVRRKPTGMNNTLKFAALLAVALGVVLSYAFVPESVALALGLKQVNVAAVCHNADGDEADFAAVDADADASAEPVDTTSQRILLFGDSMSQPLALRLSDYANANGHSLTCVTWNSSGTKTWAESDTLAVYMRRVEPTHVFVCLGSNEIYMRDMKTIERHVRQILAKIGSVPTIWIGPPNWCEDYGLNELLLRVMGKRAFFPSHKLSFDRQEDGRHPTIASSAKWMDKIVVWMNAGHSVHPIRLKAPAKRDRHYRQITLLAPGQKVHPLEHADSLAEEALPEDLLQPSVPAEQPSNTQQEPTEKADEAQTTEPQQPQEP